MDITYPIKLKLPYLHKAEVNPSSVAGSYEFRIFRPDGSLYDKFIWSSHGGNKHITMGPCQISALDAFWEVYYKI